MLAPDKRIIRAVWNHLEQVWTYRCSNPPNQIPFIAAGWDGALKEIAKMTFSPAPRFGTSTPYGFFNYNTDALFLDYGRCGNRQLDYLEYTSAMRVAGDCFFNHYNNGKCPKELIISWCPDAGEFYNVLRYFEDLPLNIVTLTAHDHYEGESAPSGSVNRTELIEEEINTIRNQMLNEDLDEYKFSVYVEDVYERMLEPAEDVWEEYE